MAEPVVVGFDPGVNGGVAWVRGSSLLHVADLPAIDKRTSAPLLYQLLLERPADVMAIELLNAMPSMSGRSLAKLHESVGICRGVCADLPVVAPTPAVWKKHFGIRGERKEQKEMARRKAMERWPQFAQAFQRVKDADRAEAALIALYAVETS
jgi:hypothetical protein